MPDFTMCVGGDCPLKDNCYRYTAEPNEYRQSVFCTIPYNEEGGCYYFWDNREDGDER